MKTNFVKTLIATAVIAASFVFVGNVSAATSDYANANVDPGAGPTNKAQFEAILNKNVDIEPVSTAKNGYWYTQLDSQTEKGLYDEMVEKFSNGYFALSYDNFSTDLASLSEDTIKDVFKAVELDHPEMYYLSGIIPNVKTSYFLSGSVDIDAVIVKIRNVVLVDNGLNVWDNLEKQVEALNAQIANFGTPFGINEGDSELTIVDKIASWTNDNCNYTYAQDFSGDPYFTNQLAVHTMYGAFCEGQVLCEGYANFVQYYLNLYGITNTKHGNAIGSHIWSMVMVDGFWYELDTTSYYNINDCFFTTDELQSMGESYVGTNNADAFADNMPVAFTSTDYTTVNGNLYFTANAPAVPAKILGDVSRNGQLDVADLVILAAHIRGIENIPYAVDYADVDHNGEITVSDLTSLVVIYRSGENIAIA